MDETCQWNINSYNKSWNEWHTNHSQGGIYMRQWIRPTLVQAMACHSLHKNSWVNASHFLEKSQHYNGINCGPMLAIAILRWPKPPCQRVFVKAVVTYAVTRLFLKQWCHIINWTLWTYNFHWKMHFKMSDSLLQNGSHLSHPQCVKKPSPCTIRCPKMNQDTMPLA